MTTSSYELQKKQVNKEGEEDLGSHFLVVLVLVIASLNSQRGNENLSLSLSLLVKNPSGLNMKETEQ